jgi:SAM-dependent methyltransferase
MVKFLPWQAKIAAKLVLARLRVPYSTWSRLNLFKHGAMGDVGYALAVFRSHADRANLPAVGSSFTCLELGPGDSLLSALVACARGSARTYLVDAGRYAIDDVDFYRRAADQIFRDDPGLVHPETWRSLDDVLQDCKAVYLTSGLESLKQIPDGTVDWSWSQAVLEHVRRATFGDTLRELRRIAVPGGRSTHRIDFQDHLGGRLNNLRFSEDWWERDVIASSGFYTNRLRASEVVREAASAGFHVVSAVPDLWPNLPTPRSRLHHEFRGFDDADLLTRCMDLTLAAI